MGVPLLQQYRVGRYILGQKLKGNKRYPLVLMLEPLFRCNLACAGCGKIVDGTVDFDVVAEGHGDQREVAGEVLKLEVRHQLLALVGQGPDVKVLLVTTALQQVYCDPGDEVIYPSPGFPIYESFIRYVRAVPVPLHLDEVTGFTFTPEQLEALITPKTKVIYLNFPSNPTGGVATHEQLEGIAKVILEKGRPDLRVYSDEIYENILFDGQQHASITAVPGMTERTIIASGFSKTYAWTGGRIGYAVFPAVEEAEVFTRLNINYFSCTAPYNQEAAKLALESPLSAPVIAKMVATFEQRRNVIWQQLNDIPGVSCQKPGGAFYLFPRFDLAMDADTFCLRLLKEAKVCCIPGTGFGDSCRQAFRISYAVGPDAIREGIRRMRQWLTLF